MTIREDDLLKILTDGEIYSGQELADRMGVSRTAIWKQISKIRDKNLEVKSIRGKGYQLINPVELLDKDNIVAELTPATLKQLNSLQIFYQTSSTNELLMEQMLNEPIQANVVLAEYQTRGVGRRGNQWLSGLTSGLCLSIGWHFDQIPKTFTALSLATGVVLAKSIRQIENSNIQLKWPNDLIYNNSKLGGILIESRGQHAGFADVVIGIGINFNLPELISDALVQKVTDLKMIFGDTPSRNYLAAIIINNMFELLSLYSEQGFEQYIDEWRNLDYLKGNKALLSLSTEDVKGTVVDIDEYGNLIMSVNGNLVTYGSGDLTLRPEN